MISLEPHEIVSSHLFGDYLMLCIKELGTTTPDDTVPEKYKMVHLRNRYYKAIRYSRCRMHRYMDDGRSQPYNELYVFIFYIDDSIERDEEKEHEAADALCDIHKNGNGLHPGVKLDFYAMKGCD